MEGGLTPLETAGYFAIDGCEHRGYTAGCNINHIGGSVKIVNLQTFLALPAGTVFMKYSPCYFESLCVKGDSLTTRDFTYGDMNAPVDADDSGEWGDKLVDSAENGTSVDLNFDCYGRDGCFEDGQLFAVYEKADMGKLITKLGECLEQAYKRSE